MSELVIQQFEASLPGTPQNDRIKTWLALHGITPEETPNQARFCVAGRMLQIELFDLDADGRRTVSMFGHGFVKREHLVPLVAAPEDYEIQTHVVPVRAFGTVRDTVEDLESA